MASTKMILSRQDKQYLAGWFSFYTGCTEVRYAGYRITREMAQPWIARYAQAVR